VTGEYEREAVLYFNAPVSEFVWGAEKIHYRNGLPEWPT
jgi:hypothetical protein